MIKEKDFEKVVNEIQRKIEQDEEANFSKTLINEYRNPINFGILRNSDAIGKIKGPCGDSMIFTLKIKNKTIIDARYWTDGCAPSIACGNMLIKIIKRKTIEEASSITSEELNRALDGVPNNHIHCTILAVNTLLKAIRDYKKKK